jgi:hypothetical protein
MLLDENLKAGVSLLIKHKRLTYHEKVKVAEVVHPLT